MMAYSMAVASRLEEEDLGEARHVGILLPNGVGATGAALGALLAGGAAAPMNPLLSVPELATLAKVGDIKVIVSGGPLLQKVEALGLKGIDASKIAPTPDVVAKLPGRIKELAGKDASDDTAVILFTSGTTGTPKAAMLTHANFLSQIHYLYPRLQCEEGEILQGLLPNFHIFGMTACIMLPMLKNLSVVYQPKFTPQGALKSIAEDKINYALMVPAMYAVILRILKAKPELGKGLAGLKLCVSGGSALPNALGAAWEQATGMSIYQGYGLTETSPVISVGPVGQNKAGAVGQPIEGVEVQIWDDAGKALPQGEIGEIVVRGHNVMKGYYKNQEATDQVIDSDGWFRTGDFGQLDPDGHIVVTGRKKELIIVAGENVYPGEIEELISTVPGVVEVAVVAGYDDTRGEFPRAVVVAFPGDEEGKLEEAINAACRDNLAPYKQPRVVEFIDALPRNALGKVLKREMEQRASA
jgi:long-chain acyl-CoA synthetase